MEHPSRVVFHFSLFKVEILRLVVRQTRWQTHAPVAVLIRTATPTRWPMQNKHVKTLPYAQTQNTVAIWISVFCE